MPEPSRLWLQTVPSLARYAMSRGQATVRARARSGSLTEAILRHTQSSRFPGLCARVPTAVRKIAALRPNRHTQRPARPFMCVLRPFLFFLARTRFGSLSSSRVRPTRSKRASARSPSRSVIPSTNSKLAYPPIDTPASPFSIFLRVLRFRKPRCAASVVDNRRRKRASRMSAPSFRRAFLPGIGNAFRKRSFLIMSLIVTNIADTVHYWGTLRILVK